MKYLACVCIILIAVDLSLQIPTVENCPSDFVLTDSMKDSCGSLKCQEDGTIIQIGCGTWQCMPGKTIGYRETDNKKPTPDCCGGPICAD